MCSEGRILIADDEETFLSATCDWLRLRGYQCDCARDGHEAAELLGENRYDVMISDIKMPGNHDLALSRRAQQVAPAMPVILITGYPSVETAVRAIDLPVKAYLLKPIDFEQLLAQVRGCVKQSRLYRHVQQATERVEQWRRDLQDIETLLRAPSKTSSPEPIKSFLAMSLRNVGETLSQLSALAESLAEDRTPDEGWDLVASAQLDSAYRTLIEAINVLEETKSLFRSKKLAQLRRKMQTVVDGWTVNRTVDRMAPEA